MNNENDLLIFLQECLEKKLYNEGLKAIIGNESLIEKRYYEIAKFKLIFLIELDKLIDASIFIKEELNVPYIPSDFEKFLNEKQKVINFQLRDNKHHSLSFEDLENIDKLDGNSLLEIIPHLKEFNLNLLVDKLQNIFNNPNVSNLIKSLLIASLSDYKLDYKFTICKEKTMIKFNPKDVFDIRDGDNYKYIINEIQKISCNEINSLELLNRLVVLYLLDLYPLVISEQYCENILAAAIFLTNNMLNSSIKSLKYSLIYEENMQIIDKICEKMNILLETI